MGGATLVIRPSFTVVEEPWWLRNKVSTSVGHISRWALSASMARVLLVRGYVGSGCSFSLRLVSSVVHGCRLTRMGVSSFRIKLGDETVNDCGVMHATTRFILAIRADISASKWLTVSWLS